MEKECQFYISMIEPSAPSPPPCIGQIPSSEPRAAKAPTVPHVYPVLFMEIKRCWTQACCFGQELRKLAFDGVPPKALSVWP